MAVVAAAVDGGVNVVQVREKDLPDEDLFSLTRRLREVIDGRALLIVNGRPEVALAAGADGVHLPEDGPHPDPKATLRGDGPHPGDRKSVV